MEAMLLPRNVQFIIETIEENGFEAYAVGGCVRDHLMGKQPKDYDITTSAQPKEIKALFPRTFDTGIKHGTVTVVIGQANIEVTTFRIDGEYLDNRRPENVEFTTDLRSDLLRRDFTMNAIAYGPNTGYIDLYGGLTDITNGIIRGVGDPQKRFDEDALRMLRAIRFAGQLGFDIEQTTYAAIFKNAALIRNISAERIRDELCKLLISECPERLAIILDSGLMEYIDKDLYGYCALNLGLINTSLRLVKPNIIFRLALLLMHMDQKRIKRLLTFLKFDVRSMKEIMLLAAWINTEITPDASNIRRILSIVGPAAFKDIVYLQSVLAVSKGGSDIALKRIISEYEHIINCNDCISISQLKINGNDLIKMGFSSGKTLGSVINHLFNMVLQHPEKNDESVLRDEALKLL